jgi:hypothetical protein
LLSLLPPINSLKTDYQFFVIFRNVKIVKGVAGRHVMTVMGGVKLNVTHVMVVGRQKRVLVHFALEMGKECT